MDEQAQEESMWTAEDVASYLKVSKRWVKQTAQAGNIPAACLAVGRRKRLWRFDPAEIRAFARGEWQPERKSA